VKIPHPLPLAALLILAGLPGHTLAADCDPQRLPVANSHVGDDDSDGRTLEFRSPPGCRIVSWKFVELSKFGDASYSAELRPDGTLQVQWHIHSSTVRGPFQVVLDTHTAALQLDVELTFAKVEQPHEPATAPLTPQTSVQAEPHTTPEAGSSRFDIISIGTLAAGIIVGVIAGLIVQGARAWPLKSAAGLVSLLFASGATKFLETGKPSRFFYPVGLLIGLVAIRLWRIREGTTGPGGSPAHQFLSIFEALILLGVLVGAAYFAIFAAK
jgi:hypothetical protein